MKSFQDSNADGIGDLPGLLSRLEYVADLGVNLLWLQPLFASPKGDNGYDVSDYRRIDPALGSLDDFREVVDRAGRLGMRVLLDLPLNHTSRDHAWFRAAQADRRSPYRPYYLWADEKPADAAPYPVFGSARGDNWTWSEEAGQYYWTDSEESREVVVLRYGRQNRRMLSRMSSADRFHTNGCGCSLF